MSELRIVKPSTEAEKSTQTTLDTWEITPNQARSWKIPPFQRPLRVNDKVQLLAKQIRIDDGVIPGVFTLGMFDRERWLIDGQHRREAFLLSECLVGFVDVRVAHYKTMAEMGEEFVNLNSQIVKMRPDDIIRGLEQTYEPLAKLRKICPFVGYDQIRRNEKSSPVASMSSVLRCWYGAANEVPRNGGVSAQQIATTFSFEECAQLADFLNLAFTAWGRDTAYGKLWGNLNVSICMWLYRVMVIGAYSARTQKLSKEQFVKCLMSLSANSQYLDWLVGRQLSPRDLAPCYSRIRSAFVQRLEIDTGKKYVMPAPAWSTNPGSSKK